MIPQLVGVGYLYFNPESWWLSIWGVISFIVLAAYYVYDLRPQSDIQKRIDTVYLIYISGICFAYFFIPIQLRHLKATETEAKQFSESLDVQSKFNKATVDLFLKLNPPTGEQAESIKTIQDLNKKLEDERILNEKVEEAIKSRGS